MQVSMKRLVQASMIALIGLLLVIVPAIAQDNVVHVVLFYSPTCPHCEKVISEYMPLIIVQYDETPEALYIPPSEAEQSVGPPLVGIYAGSLEILYVNTYTELGNTLYWNMVDRFQIPSEQQAVPLLVVGDIILLGEVEIPEGLPGIIEQGIAGNGIDWPDIPGLSEAIAQLIPIPPEAFATTTATASPTETASAEATAAESPTEIPTIAAEPTAAVNNPMIIPPVKERTILDRVKLDPVGNGISIVVLMGMLFSLAIVMGRIVLPEEQERERNVSWMVLLLCGVGIFVAAYLTYIEGSGKTAVCGPVGDCNTVNQSKYARLFGVIPVGGLGLAGYVAIIAMWLASRYFRKPLSDLAKVALLAMAVFGTAFSTYLTFLEPFVIGATCAWCLTSAIIMTVIMWLVLFPGLAASTRLRQATSPPP
jgi:uncharacterized membrane protein